MREEYRYSVISVVLLNLAFAGTIHQYYARYLRAEFGRRLIEDWAIQLLQLGLLLVALLVAITFFIFVKRLMESPLTNNFTGVSSWKKQQIWWRVLGDSFLALAMLRFIERWVQIDMVYIPNDFIRQTLPTVTGYILWVLLGLASVMLLFTQSRYSALPISFLCYLIFELTLLLIFDPITQPMANWQVRLFEEVYFPAFHDLALIALLAIVGITSMDFLKQNSIIKPKEDLYPS